MNAILTNFIKPIAATLAMMVCACNQNTTQIPDTEQIPIKLYAALASEVASKTPAVNTTPLPNVRFLRSDATIAPASFATATPLLANRAANGTIAWVTSSVNYKKNNDNAYLVAYHPATTANVVETAGVSAVWTLDGKTDVLLADRISAGNYLVPATPVMTFDHQVGILQIILQADNTATLNDLRLQYGQITAIDLINTPDKITYLYATRAVLASSNLTSLPMFKSDYTTFAPIDIPQWSNRLIDAVVMAAPQSTGKLTIMLTSVKRGQIPINMQLKADNANVAFTAGKTHTVTIILSKDIISLSFGNGAATEAKIGDWEAGYDKPTVDETI